jgi:hypothetical protein
VDPAGPSHVALRKNLLSKDYTRYAKQPGGARIRKIQADDDGLIILKYK